MITASTASKKIFLLDTMALIYRAHFAFNRFPRMTSTGINTSAIFGFTTTLLDVMNNEKPTHIVAVFDTMAPTERVLEYQGYKANRQVMPEDLVIAIPYIKKIISGFNIPVVTLDGYEADDIVGTLVKQAEQNGFISYMMTSDKDFAQLVTDKTFIYKPGRGGEKAEVLGVEDVLKKWEVTDVKQVIDILGLWGDAVDNIPGIPGIGEKSAKKFISTYGSLENLIAHAHELKGKQQENVINFSDQGLLSKKLATIICSLPVKFEEDLFKIKMPNFEVLAQLFSELEFRALGKRLLGEDFTVAAKIKTTSETAQGSLFNEIKSENKFNGKEELSFEQEPVQTDMFTAAAQNITNVEHQYHLINTPEKRKHLIDELSDLKSFCFDTETTALNPREAEIVGLSVAFKNHEAYYIPFPASFTDAQLIMHEFKAVFENDQIEKIGQNIKYDKIILRNYGVEVKGKLFDTMLAHFLIYPDMRHNMNILAETYLNYSPISIDKLIGKKGKSQGNMRDVAIDKIVEYSCEDADVTLQLKGVFEPMLRKFYVEKLFYEIEIPLINVLGDMEFEGISLNTSALNEYSKELTVDILKLEQEIYTAAGIKFNIASPKQLGEILFDKLKLEPNAQKTKTGQYATGEEVLARLAVKHEIAMKVLDFRELQKLKSTYVDALPDMVLSKTGKVHTSFNQTIAVTGRLSSNNPNLQNIPIRTAKGREVRKAFVVRSKDFVLLSADYSQIELRIIASISKDNNMINAFKNNEDIHNSTAAKIYHIKPDEVTDEMRRNAKMVNFGIIYGISAFGLSQRLGIARAEAKELIDQYFLQYPNIKKYMQSTIQFAKEKGYVETIIGRRRYLRDINSQNATVRGFAERNAINSPIQGTAADMIKIAMNNIHKDLSEKKFISKMILQVHDELVFDVHKKELEDIKPIIEHRMKTAIPFETPIVVDFGVGENWLEAH